MKTCPPGCLCRRHIRPDCDERRARAAKLTDAGWTPAQIARHLHVHRRTIDRYRRALGINHPHTPYTDVEHERALELLADGASLHEVARTLGRSSDSVIRRYQGLGWTHEQVGAYNAMLWFEKRELK